MESKMVIGDTIVKEYPKLKRFVSDTSDFIVLFTDVQYGFIVHINKARDPDYIIGYVSNDWLEDDFNDFNGKIILKN